MFKDGGGYNFPIATSRGSDRRVDRQAAAYRKIEGKNRVWAGRRISKWVSWVG